MSPSIAMSLSPTTTDCSISKSSFTMSSLPVFRIRESSYSSSSYDRKLSVTRTNPFAFDFPLESGGSGWNKNNNNNGNNPVDPWWWNDGSVGGSESHDPFVWLLSCSVVFWSFIHLQLASSALARATLSQQETEESVWEVKGNKRIKLIPDLFKDEFVVAPSSSLSNDNALLIGENLWLQCKALFTRLMLPEGFPHSVTSDYLDYSLWRAVQGVASQVSGVLATQVYIIPEVLFFLLMFMLHFLIRCSFAVTLFRCLSLNFNKHIIRHCFMLLDWGKVLFQLQQPSIGSSRMELDI